MTEFLVWPDPISEGLMTYTAAYHQGALGSCLGASYAVCLMNGLWNHFIVALAIYLLMSVKNYANKPVENDRSRDV